MGGGDTGLPARRALVFDINNEYGSRVKYTGQKPFNMSINTREDRSRYIGDNIEAFTKIAMSKQNTVVIMEEATAFFRGHQNALTSRMIINRYHTGNVYVFLFHSINRVPPEIMEIANYVVLFKTNDEDAKVKSKYSRLYPHFLELKQKENGSNVIIKLI